jgi:CRISPR-associated protein Csx17
MTGNRHVHRLDGCLPVPLASYLKALGVLRLVSEQVDASATGWWENDIFHLETVLDRQQLLDFFLLTYSPTPIVVPWSGNDFFDVRHNVTELDFSRRWPESGQKSCPTASRIIESFMVTSDARLHEYRDTLSAVFTAMATTGTVEKKSIEGPKGKEQKLRFLTALRAVGSDRFVEWLDAAVALDADDFSFNAILGSGGGSDGNSHFSDNFMQCLWFILSSFDGQRSRPPRASDTEFSSKQALENALFSATCEGTVIKMSPGLFSSQHVGGPNASAGFEGDAFFNPWDYVLLLEGATVFSGALSRRTGIGSADASFPFLMRLTPAGAGTLIQKEASGREIWLPAWNRPALFNEVRGLFAEGRISQSSSFAKNGLEAAKAASLFGADRGIPFFHRLGIIRGRVGGENYNTTVKLDNVSTMYVPDVARLEDVEDWMYSFRRSASGDNVPTSVRRSLASMERTMMGLCSAAGSNRLQDVMLALGNAQQSLATSVRWRKESSLNPVPLLSPDWLIRCDDNSTEYRLAASLASLWSPQTDGFRQYIDPVVVKGGHSKRWVDWSPTDALYDHTWTSGTLQNNLLAVLRRRVMQSVQGSEPGEGGVQPVFAGRGTVVATPADLALFLNDQTDDARIERLLRGLCLLDWSAVRSDRTARSLFGNRGTQNPDSLYTLLKLCHHPDPIEGVSVRLDPAIAALASAGKSSDALRSATRRLTGSGLLPRIRAAHLPAARIRRIAAALLFPVSTRWLNSVSRQVLTKTDSPVEPATTTTT